MTDDYDLTKDIDGSICFAPGGFSVGGENSADVPLSQIIELSDSGQLTTDTDGNYLFYKNGDDMSPTTVIIGQGSLCDPYEMQKTMRFSTDAVSEAMKRYPGYATITFSQDIRLNARPEHQNESVRELIYVTTPMIIDLQVLVNSNVAAFCNSLTITYELPSFFDLANDSELTETIKMDDFGKAHDHIIHLKGVDFTKSGLRAGERIGIERPSNDIVIEGSIKVQGKMIANSAKYESTLPFDPSIDFNISVGTMGTNLVKGRFDEKESVSIDPIELNNLPDFIRDDEVVVDVDNPVVRVSLTNEVPADVTLDAKLLGYKDDKCISRVNAGKEYGTSPILFRGATELDTARCTNVWISRKTIEIPDTVESNVIISDMNNLIRTVPDRVEIEATARTDSTQIVTLSLGKEYKATPRYELVAPLKIGPEMKIVYTKELEDLHDHLKDMELEGFVFTGDMKNNIPLDLHVVVYPLDENGNVLKDININTTDIIPANGSKSVTFTMENNDAKDVQKIYKVQIKAYAESSEALAGQYLNKNQDLQISKAKITLKGAKYNINGK